ncbi:PREDICTED: uncharacterized protein LOC106785685 [Polistes canadensis]|uniref:uncharacterized protein LOC106785685 n=1 Tax=Polistes canadensis TaxID=91411 RepID=UPI000718E714|nr:PREDICTED: uncharacterized protein LOC106785685 [Polistes canadensis]
MQIKLLHIYWYLVLLTIVQTCVEAFETTYFQSSMQTVLENRNHYKEILIKRRQEDAKFFENLKMDEHYSKLNQIMNAIANIVQQIRESDSILEMSKITKRSERTLTDQQVIDAYLSVLGKTIFFVDIYFHFPKMTEEILQSESNWKTLLSASLSYTVNFSFVLDQSIIHKMVLLERELRPLKVEDKLTQKLNTPLNKFLETENMEF